MAQIPPDDAAPASTDDLPGEEDFRAFVREKMPHYRRLNCATSTFEPIVNPVGETVAQAHINFPPLGYYTVATYVCDGCAQVRSRL